MALEFGFSEAENYLESLVSYEDKMPKELSEEGFDLEKLRFIIVALGIDLSQFRFVHVAGSKGKGTICRLVNDYLVLKGESVGLFLSPHILDVRERIMLNGQMVDGNDFGDFVLRVKNVLRGLELKVTYFECLFLVALLAFGKSKCEFVILEVGLGGKFDATNVIFPEVCCIARIEKEHTAILGESYLEILTQKLGICKPGVPVVVAEQNEEVCLLLPKLLSDGEVIFSDSNENVVREVLKILFENFDEGLFGRVLRDFSFLGRFTVIGQVVFDIAHTEVSMKMLVERLLAQFVGRDFVVLFACLKDKNWQAMARELSFLKPKFVFCDCHSQRGMSAEDLRKGFNVEAEVFEEAFKAYEYCMESLKKDQVLVVTGSNFLISSVLKRLN